MLLGTISNGKYVTVVFAKCNNERCSNFTTVHDLNGSWCCPECFIQSESGERPTRDEYNKMKMEYDWN